MANYSDVLRRLNAYRERMDLSKEAMAKILGVYGNNYHQIEVGKRMLSMDSLKNFEKNGGNLYVLFTGRERVDGPIEELLASCKSKEQKEEIFNLLVMNIEYASWLDGNPPGRVSRHLQKICRLFDEALQKDPVWKRIRKLEFLNQVQMAELLEVETKRYRRIELEQIQPDLGILCALERKLNYSPQLFFDVNQFFCDELNYYWNTLSEKSQQFVVNTIADAIEMAQKI